MSGKVTKSEIASAIESYCQKHDEQGITKRYDEPTDSWYMVDSNKLECIFGPGLKCSDEEVFSEIKELIFSMRMDQDGPKTSNLAVRGAGKVSRSSGATSQGSALEAVRECQATEKAIYSTGKGKKAAAAKTNIAALMQAGGSLEVVKRIHTIDYIEVVGRATLNGQHVDSSRSFFKQEYLAKKAWEWIIKVLIKEPEIVVGTDAYGMPEFKDGAIIKVRISDEEKNSFLVPLPAKIALWREMAREWQAAGRVCETVAYSRAADMILRSDFQSREELAEEASEVRAIQEKEEVSA